MTGKTPATSETGKRVITCVTTDECQRLSQLRHIAQDRFQSRVDMSSVACIILGGGEGTRLFPLTQSRCKPALIFGGRYRLIDVPISNSLTSGISKIFVLTQFLARSLQKHILRTYRQDTFFPGYIEVLSAEQRPGKSEWYQGTADAVRQNAEYLLETSAEFFLILSGDQLYRMDFQKLIQCTEQADVDVWVATLAVDEKEASRMGIMKINEDRHIVDFYEKPKTKDLLETMKTPKPVLAKMGLSTEGGKEFLGSMGIYLFRRSALFNLLESNPGHDFGKHLIPDQVKKGRIAAYVHDGYWEDIGTVESFYNANLALNQQNPPFSCHDELHPIFTTSSHLPGPRFNNTIINSSTICEGSIIDAKEISNSLIGQRSIIGKGTVIRDTYIIGNDYYHYPIHAVTKASMTNLPSSPTIGENCTIQRAIIDKNVCIGNNVLLTNAQNLTSFDKDPIYVRDGIIVIPQGSIIPEGFVF